MPKPRMTPKGNIITLVDTPMPASTASEMPPAMLLSTMADTTASPERNMDEEPTVNTWVMMSRLGRKQRTDSLRTLRRVR